MDQWCRLTVVLEGPAHPDLEAVDALARVVLHARRAGASVQVDFMSPAMTELLALAGLGVEVSGEMEVLEEPARVHEIEEKCHLGDPTV